MKAFIVICLYLLSSVASADISGTALVVDGDTIAISGMKVRFSGIDTPERNQTCRKAGVTWKCGYEATEILREWTHTKEVRCIGAEVRG
jgi:endonuclease YncB( thermonuclease family)